MAADITQARVLVADDAPTVRQSVRLTLAHAGIQKADTANSVGETRRRVRSGNYDIVLCDYHFGEGMSGQELLEELRRSGELPLSTIWFMITAEASYEKVVSVAEVGPDDYLLKPFTSAQLAERLQLAWQKKAFLRPVLEKIAAGDTEGAIAAAQTVLPDAGPYRIDLIRLLANLRLQAGQLDEAKLLFEEILQSRVVPWAKLGLAKVLARQGNLTQAEGILQNSIIEHTQYVDAYEELAALYLAAGRVEESMGIFEKCLEISPNNVTRLQKAGNLASMMGEPGKARQLLLRAVHCGGNSSALAPETLLQLALAAQQDGAHSEANKYLRMTQEQAKRDDTAINQAIGKMAAAVFQNKIEPLADVEPLFSHPDFTQEAAVGFLMCADLVFPPAHEAINPAVPPYRWIRQLARRFITTRHQSCLLETAAGQREAWRSYIQECGTEINEQNKQGVQLMLKERDAEAVHHLLPLARETHNQRLMLSASHAALKYLKTGQAEAKEKRRIISEASEFVDQLKGTTIDEGARLNLRDEFDKLIEKQS